MADFSNPFLSGFFGSQEAARRNDLAQMSQLNGLFGMQNQMEQRQEQRDSAPLRRQLLEAQINQMNAKPHGQPIGAGGLRMPDGTIVAPAARPVTAERWGEPYPLNGAMVQKNENTGQIRQAVNREPVTHINQPPPVTAVTLQDPNDPNGTIVVDGRSGKVFGKGPKLTDAGKMEQKRAFNMQGIGATIQSADDLLSGAGGKPMPTGSGLGTAVDYAGSLVGMSPSGSQEADQLRAVGGALVSKMPRMEGPQSDKDVALYRESAGRIGDSTLPVERRKAALQTVKDLWAKYERLNPDAFSGGSPQRRATDGGAQPRVVEW